MKNEKKLIQELLEEIKKGNTPWVLPYYNSNFNFKSKKAYNGINAVSLARQSKPSNHWLTFKQAKELKGSVKKGSKGATIFFYKKSFVDEKGKFYNSDPQNILTKEVMTCRQYSVFALCDIEGIEAPELPESSKIDSIDFLKETAEKINCKIELGKTQACFYPGSNKIDLPNHKQDADATAWHEMGHAVDEHIKGKSNDKAFNELVAEMVSCQSCHQLGIEPDLEQHGAYCRSWNQNTPEAEKETNLLKAIRRSQKILDFIFKN